MSEFSKKIKNNPISERNKTLDKLKSFCFVLFFPIEIFEYSMLKSRPCLKCLRLYNTHFKFRFETVKGDSNYKRIHLLIYMSKIDHTYSFILTIYLMYFLAYNRVKTVKLILIS